MTKFHFLRTPRARGGRLGDLIFRMTFRNVLFPSKGALLLILKKGFTSLRFESFVR